MRTPGQAIPFPGAALLLAVCLLGCTSGGDSDRAGQAAPSAAEPAPGGAAEGESPDLPEDIPALDPATALASERQAGYVGVLVAQDAVDVSSEVDGRIRSVQVRVGDRVQEGEILARVDTRPLERALNMARATLKAAQADVSRSRTQFEEARTRFERRTALPDTFSREELAAAELEMDTAQANLEAAEARAAEQELRVEQLASDLARAVIRAPFEGTVSVRYLDPGARLVAGMPVVRLINSDELLVRFAVPPTEVDELDLGDRIDVEVGDAGLETRAIIEHIAPEIDGPSQRIFVEARLGAEVASRREVRAGQLARVRPLPKAMS